MRCCDLLESAATEFVEIGEALGKQYGVNAVLEAHGPNEIQISWLERTRGARGSGGKYLAALVQLADKHRIKIMLMVWLGEPRLIDLYQRFGFEVIDPGDDEEEPIMQRLPRRVR